MVSHGMDLKLNTLIAFITFIQQTASIQHCPTFDNPRNGYVVCDSLFHLFCSPECHPGYRFASKPAVVYMCGPVTGEWFTYPVGSGVPWPDCVQDDGTDEDGIVSQLAKQRNAINRHIATTFQANVRPEYSPAYPENQEDRFHHLYKYIEKAQKAYEYREVIEKEADNLLKQDEAIQQAAQETSASSAGTHAPETARTSTAAQSSVPALHTKDIKANPYKRDNRIVLKTLSKEANKDLKNLQRQKQGQGVFPAGSGVKHLSLLGGQREQQHQQQRQIHKQQMAKPQSKLLQLQKNGKHQVHEPVIIELPSKPQLQQLQQQLREQGKELMQQRTKQQQLKLQYVIAQLQPQQALNVQNQRQGLQQLDQVQLQTGQQKPALQGKPPPVHKNGQEKGQALLKMQLKQLKINHKQVNHNPQQLIQLQQQKQENIQQQKQFLTQNVQPFKPHILQQQELKQIYQQTFKQHHNVQPKQDNLQQHKLKAQLSLNQQHQNLLKQTTITMSSLHTQNYQHSNQHQQNKQKKEQQNTQQSLQQLSPLTHSIVQHHQQQQTMRQKQNNGQQLKQQYQQQFKERFHQNFRTQQGFNLLNNNQKQNDQHQFQNSQHDFKKQQNDKAILLQNEYQQARLSGLNTNSLKQGNQVPQQQTNQPFQTQLKLANQLLQTQLKPTNQPFQAQLKQTNLPLQIPTNQLLTTEQEKQKLNNRQNNLQYFENKNMFTNALQVQQQTNQNEQNLTAEKNNELNQQQNDQLFSKLQSQNGLQEYQPQMNGQQPLGQIQYTQNNLQQNDQKLQQQPHIQQQETPQLSQLLLQQNLNQQPQYTENKTLPNEKLLSQNQQGNQQQQQWLVQKQGNNMENYQQGIQQQQLVQQQVQENNLGNSKQVISSPQGPLTQQETKVGSLADQIQPIVISGSSLLSFASQFSNNEKKLDTQASTQTQAISAQTNTTIDQTGSSYYVNNTSRYNTSDSQMDQSPQTQTPDADARALYIAWLTKHHQKVPDYAVEPQGSVIGPNSSASQGANPLQENYLQNQSLSNTTQGFVNNQASSTQNIMGSQYQNNSQTGYWNSQPHDIPTLHTQPTTQTTPSSYYQSAQAQTSAQYNNALSSSSQVSQTQGYAQTQLNTNQQTSQAYAGLDNALTRPGRDSQARTNKTNAKSTDSKKEHLFYFPIKRDTLIDLFPKEMKERFGLTSTNRKTKTKRETSGN